MTSADYHRVYDGFGFLYNSHLQDSSYCNQMGKIKDVLNESTIKIDFWGSRKIVSKKESNEPIYPVSLKEVIYKMWHTQCNRSELIIHKEVVSKLCELYEISNKKIEDCNFITYFFNRILEFFDSPSSIYFCTRPLYTTKMN